MSSDVIAAERPVKSPCIAVCALDSEDICEGCYRSVAEISGWRTMSNAERKQVLLVSAQRARQRGRVL